MENSDVPFGASRAIPNPEKKLTGFYVNLGAIKIHLVFSCPIDVPADFGYSLNVEAATPFKIVQN
jgi:hypothetical protein